MRPFSAIVLIYALVIPSLSFGADPAVPTPTALVGYSPRASRAEREWEAKFRAIPDPANLREYMRRLSARPHHVGSPYDKDNAEWILAHFKEWGLDAHIERFDVLFPTPKIRVLEVATFYTMFNLSPVGKFHVQLCGTTPCVLRGADELKKVCRKMIGDQDHVTNDGLFSWTEVECLGACVNAPMVQINYDYYEDLTADSFSRILNDMSVGKTPKPGPQVDRLNSAPIGGQTTLLDKA